jgi:hypothetical protein
MKFLHQTSAPLAPNVSNTAKYFSGISSAAPSRFIYPRGPLVPIELYREAVS